MALPIIAVYSFTGRKNTKPAFRSTLLYKTVNMALKLSVKNITDRDIEGGCAEVFKYAKARVSM